MMPRRDVCWLLVGAVALIAAVAGHAAQLSIESAHFFGSAPALYAHSLQAPFALLAAALLLVALLCIARGVIESGRGELDRSDWLLPALDVVRAISPGRLVITIIGLQLIFLVVGEFAEQSLSTYDNTGFAAIFGPSHVSAPFVHILIGTLLALALRAFARAACEHAAAIARFVLVAIARLAHALRPACAPVLRTLALRCEFPPPPLLARRIASRPPPVFAALVA